MGYSIAVRIYLSGTHFESSRYMAQEARRLEAGQIDAASRELIYCALNAVLSSVAFLEGLVNELLLDALENHHSEGTKNLSDQDRELLRDLCPLLERLSVLDKFQEILKFLRKSQIDRSTSVWSNAKALIKLRNYLVHYKPETTVALSTIDSNPVDTLTIERQLANKFPTNPYFANTTTAFISSHLSAGCAQWASETSLAFADEFFRHLGVKPPYEHLRNQAPALAPLPEPEIDSVPKLRWSIFPWLTIVALLSALLIWRW